MPSLHPYPNPGQESIALPAGQPESLAVDPVHLLTEEIDRLQRRVAELEAEKALIKLRFRDVEKSLPLMRAAAAAIPDTFLAVFDCDMRFVLAEGPLLERKGYKAQELTGKHLKEVLGKDNRSSVQNWECMYRRVLRGERMQLHVEDNNRHYEVDLIPLRERNGVIAGGLQITRDITDSKRKLSASQHRAVELAQNNAELTRYISTNVELEQFAYIAAHDLKEPLRTIISFAQMLRCRHGEMLNDEGQEFVDYIVQGTRCMEALINGLLDYSSLDKRGQLDIEEIPARDVLDQVLRSLNTQIQERGAEVIYGDLPTVHAEPVLLAQLIQNLVSNGIKFNTSECPVIRIEGDSDPADPLSWKFSVHDNGIGIPEEGQAQIFGVFRRLHNRDEYEGTGIGLAVCKKIAERHGGRIGVESRPGQGASFWFTLPKRVQVGA
jgi:PAS domain S-box-containing protein